KPIALTRDGRVLACGKENVLGLVDPATGAEVRRLDHGRPVCASAFSPDGKLLASGTTDGFVYLWDATTGKELRRQPGGPGQRGWQVAFSPDGRSLAVAADDYFVRLWDVPTGQPRGPGDGHRWPVDAVACSPDGKLVASAGKEATVFLWDAARGTRRGELR